MLRSALVCLLAAVSVVSSAAAADVPTSDWTCGVRGPVRHTLIAGGDDANLGEFPWHVAVYRIKDRVGYTQICGGSLISEAIVLTGAVCFWDQAAQKPMSPTLHKVAAGKHLRSWSDLEPQAQVRDVAEIHVPRRYRGTRSKNQHDIAVVRLASDVRFTEAVQPVCLDWTNQHEAAQLSAGVQGTVVGWGITLNDSQSDVLQKIDLPYVDFETCYDALPEDSTRFLTGDKVCAGFANKSRSICAGDSGGGLVFSTDNRYYLRGLASVGFRPPQFIGKCYTQLFIGFTLVSHYLPWIKTFVPEIVSNVPTPVAVGCPALSSHSRKGRCTLAGVDVDCDNAPSPLGTRARLACRPGFKPQEDQPGSLSVVCIAARQRTEKHLTCDHACGVRGPVLQTLIAGGEDANLGEFPWHVGIYRALGDGAFNQDCGGSLISSTFVVTGAHCFWNDALRKPKEASLYKVAVGKHLRAWSPKEPDSQVRDVAEIHIPRRFRGRISSYQHDIAVVRLASDVRFTEAVQPVCLDWTNRHEAAQLSAGVQGTIVGWGITLNGSHSEVLQKVDLPYVDFDTCYDGLFDDLKHLYSEDKFCAGFANVNRSICAGDSGGGLVFSTDNRYYLRGVASVVFTPPYNRARCYSQMYTGFTLISKYLSWIETFVNP